ncbi:glycosyltransferase [Leifsonia sp. L25]|uniref:glycosyltransferase n=1 Tax=Actinomycetes TaxID=1760 RepID=UPI003D684CAA
MTDPATPAAAAVIVVNYGSSQLLAENLLALARRAPWLTVVVVDSFSTAAERGRVAALADAEGWLAVLPEGNPGFGGGMNLGVARAREAGAQRFLLLNPDARIEPEASAALLRATEADPMALVAPVVLRPDGSVWSAGADVSLVDGRMTSARRRPQPAESRAEPWLSGACLAVSERLWGLVGGFAEEYFLYWEDVELSVRVTRAGGSLVLLEQVTAVHAEGGTQQQGAASAATAKSEGYYYYNIRNRLLFAARNLAPDDVERWEALAPRVAWEILLQGGRRQFLKPVVPLRAALRGIRDGRRLVAASEGGAGIARVGRTT